MVYNKEMTNSILIIGNGFDLACNLKSKFSNFLTDEKLEQLRANPYSCENFWYLLSALKFNKNADNEENHIFPILAKDDYLWMDIESLIKEVSTSKLPRYYAQFFKENNYLALFTSAFVNRNNNMFLAKDNEFSYLRMFFIKRFPNIFEQTINIIDFLKLELEKFERTFAAYLIESIRTTDNYYEKAYELFGFLGCTGVNPDFLIDFNYTHDDEKFNELFGNDNRIFIHGSVKNKPIIGFDSSNISSDAPVLLSKAWQKMSSNISGVKLPQFDEEFEIKFFGHSLGEQDYSYFHALFDRYDIYNKKVSLCFIYSRYKDDEKENDEITKTYCNDVYKLLNDYALRSGKESNYRTLISRLQIENRLHIYELKEYVKSHSFSEQFKEIKAKGNE